MKLEITENQPLADRIRPSDLADFIGQGHIMNRIEAIRQSHRMPSLLLFGPPGCGKSTLALLLAKNSGKPFIRLSAPEAGLTALRKKLPGNDILVLDELHRFSKSQQDFFLPILESGEITMIGSTTENPSYSVTRQLLSRLHVLRLRPLSRDELAKVAERGAEELGLDIPEESRRFLAAMAGGDARTLLNLLEYASELPADKLDVENLRQTLPDVVIRGDRDGDSHYELASAMIKSIRGSDPDAAVYYMTSLLESGEDPRFVSRRLIISAAEDIGLGNPQALSMAVACHQAVETVGMPEGGIIMAETAVYLALSPKSNSTYSAYRNTQKDIRENGAQPVPLHLRNASTALHREWGYGRGYLYPHNFPKSWADQEYLPSSLSSRSFYHAKDQGEEPKLNAWLRQFRKQNR